MKVRSIVVNGLVAKRDKEPYIQLMDDQGTIFAQLTIRMAQSIAMDMLVMAARTEMDAAMYKFASEMGMDSELASRLIVSMRDYRHKLDQEKLERRETDPETGEEIS